MNKKITLVVISLLILIIFLSGCVDNRPDTISIPTINITEETDIQLISAEIDYNIVSKNSVYFNAVYVLNNPTNKTINQTILFNFSPSVHHDFQYIEVDGEYITCDKIKGHYEESTGTTYFPTAIANITFLSNENKTLRIRALNLKAKEEFSFFSNAYSVTYESIDGDKWNNTIQYANFTIRLNKYHYDTLEIKDFDITENSEEIVATKSFTNWVPDKNFIIKFSKFDPVKLIILVIPILIIAIIIVLWKIYFRKPRDEKRNNENKFK